MKKNNRIAIASLCVFSIFSTTFQAIAQTQKAWAAQAKAVRIVRDEWGVPHIFGRTDADAAFGLLYAMAEDNYLQLEDDLIKYCGRSAERYGSTGLENDVAVRIFDLENRSKIRYANAISYVKHIVEAAAAGLNYYLHTHHQVPHAMIPLYEPWMFLINEYPTLSQLGVGNDYVALHKTLALKPPSAADDAEWLAQLDHGSNSVAIGTPKTLQSHSMLLINPHVNFFGDNQRYEAHLVSKAGLNVSGFAFLGSAFLWSGFNNQLAWSHTNSSVDKEDAWVEQFTDPMHPLAYKYEQGYRQATQHDYTILVKQRNGEMVAQPLTVLRTHHGPIVAEKGNQKISASSTELHADSLLLQCWRMMKARSYDEFQSAMNMRQLGYPTTTYADAAGNIAYWHGNAIPKRNPNFNWKKPVSGTTIATEWQGIHPIEDLIHFKNPKTGYLYNTNASPFLAAGKPAIDSTNYPYYMAPETQNFRAVEMHRLLSTETTLNPRLLQNISTSPHLPMMAYWLPQVIAGYDSLPKREGSANPLDSAIEVLRHWNHRYDSTSQATTLAVAWYLTVMPLHRGAISAAFANARRTLMPTVLPISTAQALAALRLAVADLSATFGTPWVAWGNINRLQRVQSIGKSAVFNDKLPSLSVSAAPGTMGSLFAFTARAEKNQRLLYGTYGNSYVALVDFPKTGWRKVVSQSIVYFGQSGHPSSAHYFDQAQHYAKGQLKSAWFYKKDVRRHGAVRYRPGTKKGG